MYVRMSVYWSCPSTQLLKALVDPNKSFWVPYVSRVAGATRDKYVTYRTDTGRSAVYASRPRLLYATQLSYTQGFKIPKFHFVS